MIRTYEWSVAMYSYACKTWTLKKDKHLYFWDEMLSMATSDRLAADAYKYCGKEPSWIKKKSCANGDGGETESVCAYMQDERWPFGQDGKKDGW